MSDRINGFVVVLDNDLHEDDAEKIKNAILAMKHVIQVGSNVGDVGSFIIKERVRIELLTKIIEEIKTF